MRRTILIHTLIAACLGALFIYGCWSEREAPVEAGAPTGEVEPRFSVLAVDAMESPVRLALTPRGRLLVSDARRAMILAVDPLTLRAEEGFSVHGVPLGIGLLGKRVFVGNASKRTIEVYSAQGGSYQRSFGTGAVEYPNDLAVDEVLGLVFVVDGGTKEVKVFDSRGRLRGTISGPGVGGERFQSPIAIAVDRVRGEVLVSDYGSPTGHAAVKIFAYDGTFLAEISGQGTCGMMGCTGGFSRPQGLAVDDLGRIFVADVLLAKVLVFDRETLEQVSELGGGAGDPTLFVPLDVAVDTDGDVFVTSNRTRSVEVFPNGAGQP
jgi:hypothetical protein